MTLIMVVEDEKIMRDLLTSILKKEGHAVLTSGTAAEAWESLDKNTPSLLILYRKLPDQDGAELCREIRARKGFETVPVLFLSAVKKSVTDKVVGLALGGDDYLLKPFDPEELTARVAALLRRRGGMAKLERIQAIEVGDLRLDLSAVQATLKGMKIQLWPKEFLFLRLLLERKGRILTREFALKHVWGYEKDLKLTTRTVDVTVSRLRKKLGAYGARVSTIKNYGYRFDDEGLA